jgi:hypothetical protein
MLSAMGSNYVLREIRNQMAAKTFTRSPPGAIAVCPRRVTYRRTAIKFLAFDEALRRLREQEAPPPSTTPHEVQFFQKSK